MVNVTMNHATMNRKGFVPYGPAPDGAEALSRIMATDLAGSPVTVNLLLLGGAAVTGLIPEDLPEQMRSGLLPASAMAEPIRWLCPQPRPESTTSGSLRASSPPGWPGAPADHYQEAVADCADEVLLGQRSWAAGAA